MSAAGHLGGRRAPSRGRATAWRAPSSPASRTAQASPRGSAAGSSGFRDRMRDTHAL